MAASLLNTPEYRSWQAMRQRCFNPNKASYVYYGARGITVCERWGGRGGFSRFLADMGQKPDPSCSIDRIDLEGNYEPSNCRWATPKEQANRRRNNQTLTISGETRTLAEWASIAGLVYQTLRDRVRAGWDPLAVIAVAPTVNGRVNRVYSSFPRTREKRKRQ